MAAESTTQFRILRLRRRVSLMSFLAFYIKNGGEDKSNRKIFSPSKSIYRYSASYEYCELE